MEHVHLDSLIIHVIAQRHGQGKIVLMRTSAFWTTHVMDMEVVRNLSPDFTVHVFRAGWVLPAILLITVTVPRVEITGRAKISKTHSNVCVIRNGWVVRVKLMHVKIKLAALMETAVLGIQAIIVIVIMDG